MTPSPGTTANGTTDTNGTTNGTDGTNGTKDTTNGTNTTTTTTATATPTATATAAAAAADFKKMNYKKWLAGKRQYIVHIVLVAILLLILFGVLLVIFARRSKLGAPWKGGNSTGVLQPERIQDFGGEGGHDSRSTVGTVADTAPVLLRGNLLIQETTSRTNFFSDNVGEIDQLSKHSTVPTAIEAENFEPSQCAPVKEKECVQVSRKNPQTERKIPSEDTVAELGHFMGWRPKHYELNITINRDAQLSFSGSADIYVKAIETTSSLSLHAGRSISDITLSQISVHNCHTGEVHCVASIVYHQKDEVLSLEFAEPIGIGQIVVLHITNFTSPQASAGLIVKSPQRWEPKRPWTVTTFFQLRNARSVFPCFDLPIMKATMKMCVTHPVGTQARSNTKMLHSSNNNRQIESCFDQSPPMSSYLYAFTIFDRMSSLKEAAKPQEHLPEIEVLYSEEDSIIKPDWINTEAAHALKMMANISGFRYPLDKINMMASFLPVYGVENFGLIILDERFVAYPKYRLAHTILAHEIGQHWIGNIVTIKTWKEMCLQEGLSTYLEWMITESLDNSTDINEMIGEKRREGIMKDSTTNTTIISEFRSHDDISRCFDKSATFFVMLELGFGKGTVAEVVRLLMERYKYANAGVAEWRAVIEKAANDPLAGEFFEKYFTQPGLPLIRVYTTAQDLTLTQSITAEKRLLNIPPTIVPLDVAIEDTPNRTVFILSNQTQTFPLRHTGLVVLDPDTRTHTVIIYEPEDYLRLMQCTERSECRELVKPDTMKRIADDFCWAFLGDHFTIPENMPHKARVWIQFMQTLSKTDYVRGSCACCINKDLEKSGTVRCKWHWKDVCEKLDLLKQIQQFT